MNVLLEGLVDLLPEPGTIDAKGLQCWLDAFSAVLELVYGGTVLSPIALAPDTSGAAQQPALHSENGSAPAPPPPAARPPRRRRRRSWSETQKRAGARRGHDVGATQAARETDAAVSVVRQWMAKYPAERADDRPRPSAAGDLVPKTFPSGPFTKVPVDQDAARAAAAGSL